MAATADRDERRRFNRSEKTLLYGAGNGVCAACGEPLTGTFHADHVTPYSRGGETNLDNGQALCQRCNLSKGANVVGINLRHWQRKALAAYLERDARDFLMVCTPGGGKTIAALEIARALLERGTVDRIVVVVPSFSLKEQWGRAAEAVGFSLDYSWTNGSGQEAGDYRGLVTTYQAVASGGAPYAHATMANKRPTLVIFDEIHHAGDELEWGRSLQDAFGNATRRLSLSGTPFRTDNNPIPFVSYVDDRSVADFRYEYGDALRDGVCRSVTFPSYEGQITWVKNSRQYSAKFGDYLPDKEASNRLRTAVDTNSQNNLLRQLLTDANNELTEIRKSHADAGGLIVALDQSHARHLATIIGGISGETPAIAVSDDDDAHKRITEFAASRQKWIVAVRMISEGVDIKRLRVGVYATNILSELFFRQFIGRFVRMIADENGDPTPENQSAYVYLPRDESLVQFAERIKDERSHELKRLEEMEVERTAADGDWDDIGRGAYMPIAADHLDTERIFDGERFDEAELERARNLGALVASKDSPEQIALMLRRYDQDGHGRPESRPTKTPRAVTKVDVKKAWRDKIKNRVNRICFALDGGTKMHAKVHHDANQACGIPATNKATLDQLEKKFNWLGMRYREVLDA